MLRKTPLWRIENRRLVHLDEQAAVFHQERRPVPPLPIRPGLMVFLTTLLIPFAIAGLLIHPEEIPLRPIWFIALLLLARTSHTPSIPTQPEVESTTLSRSTLVEKLGPTHPFSDMGYDDTDYTALHLIIRIEREPGNCMPDFEGEFNLLEGVDPDFRWYITTGNQEALRRKKTAHNLFSATDGKASG